MRWFVLSGLAVGCSGDKDPAGTGDTSIPGDDDDDDDNAVAEACTGGADEDGDGDRDCADTDCDLICDADQDGADAEGFGGDDCDDDDDQIFPAATEVCNTIDDDCDGLVDDADSSLDLSTATDWYPDRDLDGFGLDGPSRTQCDPPSMSVSNPDDCDDEAADVNPDALEICDGIDNDCDQDIDDDDGSVDVSIGGVTWYPDADGDGVGDDAGETLGCDVPADATLVGGDCDDADDSIGVPEPWVEDTDGDGYGAGTPSADGCLPPYPGWVQTSPGLDCDETNDTIHPDALDVCDDLVDSNCDGVDCIVCTEIVVGILPGWGSVNSIDTAFATMNQDPTAYGECPVRFVDVGSGFDLDDLLALGANVVWIGDPAVLDITYTADEVDALRQFTSEGHGGIVSTLLLAYDGFGDNSGIADLFGIDAAVYAGTTSIQTSGQPIDVLIPDHPLMTGLPSPFVCASYPAAQEINTSWTDALLPGAEIVASSGDELEVVVAYDGGAWNGVLVSSYPEYLVIDDASYQLLYNMAYWAGGFEQPF